jgi:hypothetical protein
MALVGQYVSIALGGPLRDGVLLTFYGTPVLLQVNSQGYQSFGRVDYTTTDCSGTPYTQVANLPNPLVEATLCL